MRRVDESIVDNEVGNVSRSTDHEHPVSGKAVDNCGQATGHAADPLPRTSDLMNNATQSTENEGIVLDETDNVKRRLPAHHEIPKNDGRPRFRGRRRNGIPDRLGALLRLAKPLNLLPIIIIISGCLTVYFAGDTRMQAVVITLLTAGLTGLSVFVGGVVSRKDRGYLKAMRDRFERLEDRAWELHESEERYRILARAFGDIMVLRDSGGAITYANEAYERLLVKTGAISPDKLLPRIVAKSRSVSKDGLSQPPDETATGRHEVMVETSSGDLWLQWENVPVRDSKNGGMGMLSVARDITPFKRSEQLESEARKRAEDASRLKSRFLAMASHEMRTPLNGIIGMSRLLAGTALTGEQKNYTAALQKSGENLLELINGMLDLTMIEAGRFETRKSDFDFPELMNSAVELISPRAYEKGIDCGLFIDPAIPTRLFGDPARIRQIVFNLAGNAIKYTQTGGLAIHCAAKRSVDSGGDRLVISVRDSGPGLTPTDRDRIFEEFERVDDEATRKSDGAGLGLAISRALAGQLGGELALADTGSWGSTFTLDLPLEGSDDYSNPPVECRLVDERILIVSTGRMEPGCLAETIIALGGEADQVRDLKQADDHIQQTTADYSAILFDQAVIGSDENMLAEFAKNLPPATRLILMTPAGNKAKLERYRNVMDGWLVRPVRSDSLLAVLADATGSKETPLVPTRDEIQSGHPGVIGRVLLAEDNDINALLVTAALQNSNIEVERVGTGADALRAFLDGCIEGQSNSFDVVLMDMHMPVMDGLEAIESIRQAETETGAVPTPIYALTADEQSETRERASALSINGFLVKPVCPEDLCNTVRSHLSRTSAKLRKSG